MGSTKICFSRINDFISAEITGNVPTLIDIVVNL